MSRLTDFLNRWFPASLKSQPKPAPAEVGITIAPAASWSAPQLSGANMTQFTGGTPPVTFSNDDLYNLGKAITGASAPGSQPPPPGGQPPPSPAPGGVVRMELSFDVRRTIVPMVFQDIAVLHFKTPNAELPNAGFIAGAEYTSARCMRYAVISTKPGDFSTGLAGKSGTSISFDFNVTTASPQPWVYPLLPNTDYYLNISNQSGVAGQDCTMFIDINPPH